MFDVARQREYRRWLPPAKPLLLLPHFVCLVPLLLLLLPVYVLAALSILATGSYPRPLFQLSAAVFRWTMRVAAYLYLLTDAYPPFALGARPDYPVRFELDRPAPGSLPRWRPLLSWAMVIPQLLFLPVVYASVCLMLLIVLLWLVLTGIFPPGVFDFIVRALSFNLRVNAYALCLARPYPRFAF